MGVCLSDRFNILRTSPKLLLRNWDLVRKLKIIRWLWVNTVCVTKHLLIMFLDRSWNFTGLKTLIKKIDAKYFGWASISGTLCAVDMCSTSTLFILLSDLFDTISLDDCEEVFSFVEERVSLWKLVSRTQSVCYNEDDVKYGDHCTGNRSVCRLVSQSVAYFILQRKCSVRYYSVINPTRKVGQCPTWWPPCRI